MVWVEVVSSSSYRKLTQEEARSLLDRPCVPIGSVEHGASSGSEFYTVETSMGPRLYPRVSSALDGMSKPWLARWIAKTEREAFRAAAVEQVMSTQLGDGPTIERQAVAKAMSQLSPVMESERLKERAATFGTKLHGLIERYLGDGNLPTFDASKERESELEIAFNKWREWWQASGLTIYRTEMKVSCRFCGYGGTLDALAHDGEGRLWVLDWKSSKRISDEYGLQASAYSHASPEPVYGAKVVRIPHTKRASVEVRSFDGATLAEHLQVFQCALTLSAATAHAAVSLAFSKTIKLSAMVWKYWSRSCASSAAHVTVRYEIPAGCGTARWMAARDPELMDAPLSAGPSATSQASPGRSTGMGMAAMLIES